MKNISILLYDSVYKCLNMQDIAGNNMPDPWDVMIKPNGCVNNADKLHTEAFLRLKIL